LNGGVVLRIFLIILLLLVIIFIGVVFIAFRKDMNKAYEANKKSQTEIYKSTFGDIEYKTEGRGIPVLVSHGLVGGYDQALQSGKGLFGEGYEIIGASRFGYLNSDLPAEPTPKNQAQAFTELVKHLGKDKIIIMATSAGGASALRFALEYPEMTRGLVLVGSGGPSDKDLEGPTGPPNAVINDFMFWVMAKPMKSLIITKMFGIESEIYKNASSEKKAELNKILESMLPIKPKKEGIINDSNVTNVEPVEKYDEYVLEKLDVPVLIFHSKNDPMASFETAKNMHQRLPNSKLVEFETGGHLLFGHEEEIQRVLNEHFKN